MKRVVGKGPPGAGVFAAVTRLSKRTKLFHLGELETEHNAHKRRDYHNNQEVTEQKCRLYTETKGKQTETVTGLREAGNTQTNN